MKIDAKTMLEAFDETGGRGDALTLSRDSLVAFANVPPETFAPIFHRLFQWFVNGDETPLADPLANAMLESMKEHQRKNAVKRRAYLVAQSEKGRRSAEQRSAAVNHGEPRPTKPNHNKAKAKAEAKDISVSKSLYSFASDAGRKARCGRPHLAPALSENGARKFFALNAPQVCSLPSMQNASGKPNARCLRFLKADLETAVAMVGESLFDRSENPSLGESTFDAPVAKIVSTAADEEERSAFRRVLAKALEDCENGDAENPPAFVMARVKECRRALDAISNTDRKE